METFRPLRKVLTGQRTADGAGVRLTRVIGHRDTGDADPFLLLDAFDSADPREYIRGFPWHPHRGIETVTYLVQGRIEHGDSLGNQGVILDGDCQWMTAGRGIVHQEMPKATDRLQGVQLWLNLPAASKMAPPAYGDIRRDAIPVVQDGNCQVRIIAGSHGGKAGAFEGRYVKAMLLDVLVPPSEAWSHETRRDVNVLAFVLEGQAHYGPEGESGRGALISQGSAALFGEGERFGVRAGEEGLRLLFLSAPPLREPIAWGGPIVMNTREELETAFRELEEGSFIREGG